MKFAENIFPLGTFKKQQTAGAYIDGTLAQNFDVIAKKIADDMHFLGIYTGSDAVGNGKSTKAQQDACYFTNKINELHGTNNTFTHKNVFFNAKDLTEKSPELPKYSVVILDEGDDLTTHGMKELAVRLKRYFRKCRQLNQIVLLILPSFFELPKFYALSRSHFLINVSFEGEYERGYFKFYGPRAKKLLYLRGKKEWDYSAYRHDFQGRFFSSYCFFPDLEKSIELYKRKKYQDMIDDHKAEEEAKTPAQIKKEVEIQIFNKLYKNLSGITLYKLAEGFAISRRTATNWVNKGKYEQNTSDMAAHSTPQNNNNNPIQEDNHGDEGERGRAEQ